MQAILRLLPLWGPRLLWGIFLASVALTTYRFSIVAEQVRGGYSPYMMEFVPFYAGSLQLMEHPAETLYQTTTLQKYMVEVFPHMHAEVDPVWLNRVSAPPWLYPPTFNFLIQPLGLIPYWGAFVLWSLVTAIPFLMLASKILPARVGIPFALAAPPSFYNYFHAQTGFLTAGFIGLGLWYLRTRPVLAGGLIGLASFKPHLGILVPIALVASGHWKAALSATVVVLFLVAASMVAWGIAPWQAYWESASGSLSAFDTGRYSWIPMTTVMSFFGIAGFSMDVARGIQFVAFLGMAALIARVWWGEVDRDKPFGLQAAVLCIATPLALPMVYIYDLTLLVPAVAWIGADLWRNGGKHWEWCILAGCLAATLSFVSIANAFGIQIGPLVIAGLLALALGRFRSARN